MSDLDLLLAATISQQELREEALPVVTAEGRSLVSLRRRLLASSTAMTAEAALRAAEAAELVKVGSHVRWQRQGGVYGTVGRYGLRP